jgi:hypothetical protein
VTDTRQHRAVPGTRTVLLLIGDILVLTTFTVVGRRSHEEAVGWTAARAIAETAAPFVVGWLAAAAALGATRAAQTSTLFSMGTRTIAAWTAGFPLVVVTRALLLGRVSPWSFYMVAYTIPLLMLTAWRAALVLITRGAHGRGIGERRST